MERSELRKTIIAYYEAKVAKGALMAVDDIRKVRNASDADLFLIRKLIAV